MSKYVFTGAKCICQTSPTAQGTLTDNNKVSGESHNGIINTECTPQMQGICSIMTAAAGGVPQDCMPAWATPAWTNIENVTNIKVLGKRPLLESGLRVCLKGGVVKIYNPLCTKIYHSAGMPDFSKIHRIITTAKSKGKMDTGVSAMAMKAMGDIYAERNMPATDISSMSDIVVKDKDGNVLDFSADKDYQNAVKSAVRTAEMSHEERQSILGENVYRASDFLCSGKCPEGVSCELSASVPRSSVVPKKASNGQTLKENMNKNNSLSDYDNETLRIIEKMNNDKDNPYRDKVEFTVEYHHLISGEQCFGKCTSLVELANLYGYDINSPENGIPLPSFKVREGQSLSEEELQSMRTYIMDKTGRQLHKGGHSYKTKLSEKQVARSDYESSVTSLLQNAEKKFIEKNKSSCRMNKSGEVSEKEAEDFRNMMNGISQYIRDSVMSFPSPPDKSPQQKNKRNFYVSYASAEYDYNKNHNK